MNSWDKPATGHLALELLASVGGCDTGGAGDMAYKGWSEEKGWIDLAPIYICGPYDRSNVQAHRIYVDLCPSSFSGYCGDERFTLLEKDLFHVFQECLDLYWNSLSGDHVVGKSHEKMFCPTRLIVCLDSNLIVGYEILNNTTTRSVWDKLQFHTSFC